MCRKFGEKRTRERINKMQPKTIELFVPGRLCLFGEHSDWAGVNRILP